MSLQPLKTPESVDIALTGRCNLRCKYCFYADEMVGLSDLPTETWLDFFGELRDLSIMRVVLTGGEVFTRPDLFELIDGVIQNRMRYQLLTNATLITEKVLEKFEVGKRRLRLDGIQVSIDGSRAEIHDKSRPKSFDRAIRGLRLLKEAGFPVNVRVTINQYNLDDLENIARLLIDDIGLPGFGTNDAMPVGSGCHFSDEICLTHNQQIIAMDSIKKLMELYPGRLHASAGPQANIKMYASMEEARRQGKPTEWWMGHLTACGTVFNNISVLHDGTIVPCHMLSDLALGNITADSLSDVWYNHPTLIAMRERRNIPMSQVAGCEHCEWNRYCNGSCPGLAYQLTGDFNRADPKSCYRNFLAASQMTGVHNGPHR